MVARELCENAKKKAGFGDRPSGSTRGLSYDEPTYFRTTFRRRCVPLEPMQYLLAGRAGAILQHRSRDQLGRRVFNNSIKFQGSPLSAQFCAIAARDVMGL